MDILVRSCQHLRTILAKICQDLGMVFILPWYDLVKNQESHVPKKNFIVKFFFDQKKPERKSTKINIYADLHCSDGKV